MAITVPVGYNTDGANLDKQLTSDVTKAGAKAGDAGGKSLGGSLIKGLAAAGVARGIGGLLVGAVNQASDLNEAGTALAQVFGKGVKQVEKFADAGAASLGLSNLAAKNAAQTFGVYGKAAGLAGKENAKFSTKLVGLATDLASFYNSSPEEAIEAIGSGLRGEAEPLRRFGVLLDDATLRAEALKLGLIATTKDALTPQQKVLAAQSAILKQTGVAQGDFERTSGGLANQSRILTAQIDDLKGEVGKGLLPVIQNLVSFANREAIPAISQFADDFADGVGPAGQFRDVLEDTGEKIKDVANVGKDVLGFFNGLPGPVKKTAVELGLAYLVLGKLKIGLDLVAGSATRAAGAFVAVRATSTAAAVSVDRYASNSAAVAARNAAMAGSTRATTASFVGLKSAAAGLGGAGGLLLLSRGLGEANTGLSLLENTAGGALLGFAVGGPIGAAIGGGAGAVFTLGKALFDSGEAAKAATPKYSDYAASLDEVTGASSRATRQLILQDAQENGLAEKTRALGISDRLLVRGIANTGGARAKLVGVLREQNRAADDAFAKQKAALAQENIGTAVYRNRLSGLEAIRDRTKEQTAAVLGQIGVLDKSRLKQLETNVTLAQGRKETQEAKKALDDYRNTNGVATIGIKGDKPSRQQIKDVKAAAADVARTWTVTVDADNRQALAKIRAVIAAANAVADRWSGGKVSLPPGRAMGGPVRAGQPYIVGEKRPELFVPSVSGRIEPRVPATSRAAVSAPEPSVVVNQIYYGPTTSRERLSELTWTLTYGTRARSVA